MPRITISYRRNDSEDITGRIYDRLIGHYGSNAVFLDIDAVPLGANFRNYIDSIIQGTDCLLVVVSPRWLGPRDDRPNRIHDRNDPVRVEIAAALRHGIPILPLFVGHATMPGPELLPEDLSDFPDINGIEISSGRDFEHHVDRLTRWLDTATKQRGDDTRQADASHSHPAKFRRARAGTWIAASMLATFVAILVIAVWHPWTSHPVVSVANPGSCKEKSSEVTVLSEVLPRSSVWTKNLQRRSVSADIRVTVAPKGNSLTQGQLLSATIHKSSGNEALDRSALQAAQEQVYAPKLVNCRAMTGSLTIYYVFSLPTARD